MADKKNGVYHYREGGKLIANVSAILIPVSLGLGAVIFSNVNYNFPMWVRGIVFALMILQSISYLIALIVGTTLYVRGEEEKKTLYKVSFFSLIAAIIITAVSYSIITLSIFFG